MTKKDEELTLLLFLKNGYSARSIDNQLGLDIKVTKGKASWRTLKKYFLVKEDKHRLFLFRSHELKIIIKKIRGAKDRSETEKILIESKPVIISKYKNSYLLAKTEKDLSQILSGEIRNLTNEFFKNSKVAANICQFSKCKRTDLQTAHLKEARPIILINAAQKSKIGRINELQIFDIYETSKKYLQAHSSPQSISFLCPEHHKQQDKLKKQAELGNLGAKKKYHTFIKQIAILK